jgi:hypothetical protein
MKVLIEIRKGCAHIIQKHPDIELEIRDYDLQDLFTDGIQKDEYGRVYMPIIRCTGEAVNMEGNAIDYNIASFNIDDIKLCANHNRVSGLVAATVYGHIADKDAQQFANKLSNKIIDDAYWYLLAELIENYAREHKLFTSEQESTS